MRSGIYRVLNVLDVALDLCLVTVMKFYLQTLLMESNMTTPLLLSRNLCLFYSCIVCSVVVLLREADMSMNQNTEDHSNNNY